MQPGRCSSPSGNSSQEKTNYFKEEDEEGQSKIHPQETGQSHYFCFRYKFKKHAVACDKSKTVIDALNTNKIFKKIKDDNIKKEIVIQRSAGEVPRAAVKTDFPCCLIKNDELLDITFIRNGENVPMKRDKTKRHSFSSGSENLVTFYIKTNGGKGVKRLMKNNELRRNVDDVCVYGFKGNKLKHALKHDGRFTKELFKKQCALSELESETIYGMKHTIEHLDGKHFELIVINNNQPESLDSIWSDSSTEMNEESATDLKENIDPNQHPSNTEQEKTQRRSKMRSTNTSKSLKSLKKIPNSEETVEILCAQLDGLLEIIQQRQNLKNKSEVQKFLREEFDKSVQSFLEVKKVKKLMTLSESVCQIRVDGSARGTGFLLFDRFLLTNAHVIGEFDPFSKKLSKTFTAVFGYEDLEANETKCVPIKERVAAYFYGNINMERLDFALLELKTTDEIADRPELLRQYINVSSPNHGGICIVGHPDGGIKKMDPCLIIGKENVKEAHDKHISENAEFIHVITQQSLAEKWELHDNQIMYNSCFFHGSSGSPVFDEDCYLIGMHTGGYVYPGAKGKTRSIMEYGYSLKPILQSIITQARNNKRPDILKSLSEYKTLNLNLEDNDVEMEEHKIKKVFLEA